MSKTDIFFGSQSYHSRCFDWCVFQTSGDDHSECVLTALVTFPSDDKPGLRILSLAGKPLRRMRLGVFSSHSGGGAAVISDSVTITWLAEYIIYLSVHPFPIEGSSFIYKEKLRSL